jgi:hypothetical protein
VVKQSPTSKFPERNKRKQPQKAIMPAMKIDVTERDMLIPLFEKNRYDRVLINSVLQGYFGISYADSCSAPAIARLDSGTFTMFGGDPHAPALKELLCYAPICYVTPETSKWRKILQNEFGNRISLLEFTEFSSSSLNRSHLVELTRTLPEAYELRRINSQLAERLPSAIENTYFFENFHSIDDFLNRGIGYCITHQDTIVSAATSTAMCNGAIDIEIETVIEFQKKGLGTAVGAKLVLHCLENSIEPQWLAANSASEKLAVRLGYTKGESYETFEIRPRTPEKL